MCPEDENGPAKHRIKQENRRCRRSIAEKYSAQHSYLLPPPQIRNLRRASLDVHLILDNYGTHKTQLIRNWLAKRPRFHLHFTPTSASWINLVERWFAEITNKWIRRGTHRSVKELAASITYWVGIWNEDPRPYVWHKTADEIFDSLARYCQRISESGH